MNLKIWAAVSALVLTSCMTAPDEIAAAGETSIPYVASDGIIEWEAAGEDTLYIKSMSGEWYRVRTMGPCPRLAAAITLGFETSALNQLDRHGAILAEGQRCPVASVMRSGPPPEKAKG